MDARGATRRFTTLVAGPESEIPVAEAALVMAAHDHEVDVVAARERLGELAAGLPNGSDAERLARLLFVDAGYAGNALSYDDPDNSFLDRVLDRRLGIPISLSVLMIEVGRLAGVAVVGIGLPGHFLVRDGADRERFFDPFRGGSALDRIGCRERFAELHGPEVPWHDTYLEPVGARTILTRMLANLRQRALRVGPASTARWTTELRLVFPDVPVDEQRSLAAVLASLGSFDRAAAILEAAATGLDGARADTARRDAAALRARSN